MLAPSEIHTLQVIDLKDGVQHDFNIQPSSTICATLAAKLNLLSLHKLSLKGCLIPYGPCGWRLKARARATVIQACVVTLDPVSTQINEEVLLKYLPMPEIPPESSEIEMPKDVSQEPLMREIDLLAVLSEAIALALPSYPRSNNARLVESCFTEPGKSPLRDKDLKPFAVLATLKDQFDDTN